MIDFANLEKAVAALQEAIQIYEENPQREDGPEKKLQRDGGIRRFVVAFELSWKSLKRFLEKHDPERIVTIHHRDLFRIGFEQDLLDDPTRWFHYLEMRNQTSQIYDDAKAQEVFCAACEFLPDAQYLLKRMKEAIG